jgi:gamma-glutamyl hercynylcysteine S-oxide synthase
MTATPSTRSTTRRDQRAIADALTAARARTLDLLDPVPVADQERQVSELMSPLCWDLAHIGHYEELWLVRALASADPIDASYDDIYDAFKHARRYRAHLPILDATRARHYIASVRDRACEVLDGIEADALAPDAPDALLAHAFVYGMVVQHEHQHDETMLATLQLAADFVHPDADGAPTEDRAVPAPGARSLPRDVLVPGGTFVMGTSADGWAYDNERPAREVEVPAFRIDSTPVTNRAYQAFLADGGYDDHRHWSADGWEWRRSASLVAPGFWSGDGAGGWIRRRFGRTEEIPPDEPVQHVCWYEADAYARWSGARLPTETEWERAAIGAEPSASNLWRGQGHRWSPAPVRTSRDGASHLGVHGMLGDVWEWTSSDFSGHDGFVSFPYREYSEVFFDSGYKVLRGGSWATDPVAARATFRNWDFPIRRQIFAGFRCARDDV